MAKDRQMTFDFQDSLDKLGKSLEGIAPAVEEGLQAAIQGVAEAAYASIMAKAQADLGSLSADYLKGLRYEALDDNSYLISLDGEWANSLEDGYGPYDMRSVMLKSNKIVEVGSRAGKPWVQDSKPKGKDGTTHKFAHVPFEHHPFAKAGSAGDMASAVKALMGANIQGKLQGITEVFKGADGRPLEGQVAVAHLSSVTDPRLESLTKYQQVVINSKGKETVQSTYLTYRTISQIGKPWIHPGRTGVSAFDDAEKEIQDQIEKIINALL